MTQSYTLTTLFAERAREALPPLYGPEQDHTSPVISLTYGLADPACFPYDDLETACADVLAEQGAVALNYSDICPDLIQYIATRLRTQGVNATPERLIVSHGSGQILALLPQVFVDPGDVVIVEAPTFLGAVKRFARAGARIIGIPLDNAGIDTDALEEVLTDLQRQRVRPKFIYTIPNFHNPAGVTLSLERRRRLVELANYYGVVIVEDDAYGELRFEGDPLPPIAAFDTQGWVISVGTFSKTLAPGLRTGWACANEAIIQRLSMLRTDTENGPFTSRVVMRYCTDGRYDHHIDLLRNHYRQKRDSMLQAIARELPSDAQVEVPGGGFFVWCRLPAQISATSLLPIAQAHGVEFLPGTACFTDGHGDNAMRLAFSYQPSERIQQGIARLGAAIRSLE